MKNKEVYEQIFNMYHEICVSFPQLTGLDKERKRVLSQTLKVFTPEQFKLAFQKAENSKFLRGEISIGWRASFDWIIKEHNMRKILEGNYDDRKPKTKTQQELDNFYENITEWAVKENR